jgi:hypothetical protein
MRAAVWKGTSELVAPHDLSSKFLLRMRGKDRSPALASLDQPAILRPVCGGIYSGTDRARDVRGGRLTGHRRTDWTRDEATTATTRHRAFRQYTRSAKFIKRACAGHGGRRLHLRRAHQERHTLLATRSWPSALLATQRRGSDAASGEVAY